MPQSSADFTRRAATKDTKIYRRKAYVFDSLTANHTWNNKGYEYGRLIAFTGENRFIDPTLWHRFLDNCEARLDAVIERERQEDKEG